MLDLASHEFKGENRAARRQEGFQKLKISGGIERIEFARIGEAIRTRPVWKEVITVGENALLLPIDRLREEREIRRSPIRVPVYWWRIPDVRHDVSEDRLNR